MFRCPVCREPKLTTEDPNDDNATWVALGEVVCGRICHEQAYELNKPPDSLQLPLRLNPG